MAIYWIVPRAIASPNAFALHHRADFRSIAIVEYRRKSKLVLLQLYSLNTKYCLRNRYEYIHLGQYLFQFWVSNMHKCGDAGETALVSVAAVEAIAAAEILGGGGGGGGGGGWICEWRISAMLLWFVYAVILNLYSRPPCSYPVETILKVCQPNQWGRWPASSKWSHMTRETIGLGR